MSEQEINALKEKAAEASAVAGQVAGQAKETALAAFEKAKAEGFFSHYMEYNKHLLMPWSMFQEVQASGHLNAEGLKEEAMKYLTLSPTNPAGNFVLFNILALWVGVLESVIFGLFGHGFFSLVWNGAVAYCVAYTLYWVVTKTQNVTYMKYALGFIALYIAFNVYMGVSTLLFVLPAALYFTKAGIDLLMLISAYSIFKPLNGGASMI